jgi:hypothetical protein
MRADRRPWAILAAILVLAGLGIGATLAGAETLPDDGGAEWQLAQPEAPEPPPGVERPSWLVGLGGVGDIEFEAPNRGALITSGNGSTVSPGVWLYNGRTWRELATVCGATNGRIAWAGPDEFWTVSDGRPGQAANDQGNLPPLTDNTLCHFAVGPSGRFEVVGSYATLGFQSTSYQAMHGAGCLSGNDCWFGGDPLPEPGIGAFQLHWNGHSVVSEPYLPEGHAIGDIQPFEGSFYESLHLREADHDLKRSLEVPSLRRISAEPPAASTESIFSAPLYGSRESPYSLAALNLSSDGTALWGAAGPSPDGPESSHLEEAGVTVVRYSKLQFIPSLGEYIDEAEPAWTQVVGPGSEPQTGIEAFGEGEVVNSIGAEPETNGAWLALGTELDQRKPNPTAPAVLARISADGTISDRLQLPPAGESLGPKGAANLIRCPAAHDCWMVSTQGWLFHLSVPGEQTPPAGDAAFTAAPGEVPISFRPEDEGVPQTQPDAPPEDDSGLGEGAAPKPSETEEPKPNPFATVTLPLLSHVRTRLVHGATLQLSFHLAVRARVRLVAKRHGAVVARTAMRTLKAGNRSVLLALNPKRWPTKLDLETHALAPLPTSSTREANTNTVGTSEFGLDGSLASGWGLAG